MCQKVKGDTHTLIFRKERMKKIEQKYTVNP